MAGKERSFRGCGIAGEKSKVRIRRLCRLGESSQKGNETQCMHMV